MNTFEIIILALALVFNSFTSYLNAGITLTAETLQRKFQFTGIMFVVQFIMAGTGIWLGYKMGSLEIQSNMLISLSIMLIFGLKTLLSGIKVQAEEKAFDYTDNKVAFFASLAEGITPLVTGIAIGLLSEDPYKHWFLIGIFLLTGIITGLFLAVQMGIGSLKLRLGPIGGLLMIAAAFKLFINLTGF